MSIRAPFFTFAFGSLAAVVVSGCGASAGDTNLCAGANPPPECAVTCEPPPAVNTCPAGFTCSADGLCNGGTPPDASLLDADCPSINFTASPTIPTVQLLIDQSGSMDANFGGVSRWKAVKNALIDPTTGVVKELENSVVFGASLYTSNGGGTVPTQCPILRNTAARALGSFDDIATLLNSNGPQGDTPTGESIDAVVADFALHPPAENSPAIIVLATDGEPDTCANPDGNGRSLSVAAAADAYAANVRVFVLSVGNAVAETHLQEVANAGVGMDPTTGTAPYFVANNAAQLRAAFDTIIGGVVSCDLALDGSIDPNQAGSGTVTLNGVNLMFGSEWEAVDADTIRLVGAACDTLTSSTNPVVTANFPCGAVID